MSQFTNAKVRNMIAYEVKGDHDCEGRGPRYVVGYFTSREVANKASEGVGAMGSPGYIEAVNVVEISFENGLSKYFLDKPIMVKSVSDQEIKKIALSKLTEEERRVLNLK